VGFGVGLFVSIVYWGLLVAGQTFGVRMSLSPGFSMWLPDAAILAAEAAARSDTEKLHLRLERLMYDNLREFVAAEKAKREGDLVAAARVAKSMVEARGQMRKITPFIGWDPYPTTGIEWEQKRLEDAAAMVTGKTGDLVAFLPATARFRTDPFDMITGPKPAPASGQTR
jgi:hypothetical protein